MDLGEGKKKKKKGGGSDERTCRHRCRRKKRQQYQAGVICTRCQTTRLRRRQLPRGSIVKSHHLPEVNANMFTYCQVPRPDMGRFTSLPWTSIPIFIVGMVAEPNPRTVVSRMDNILGERVLMNVFCVNPYERRSTRCIFQDRAQLLNLIKEDFDLLVWQDTILIVCGCAVYLNCRILALLCCALGVTIANIIMHTWSITRCTRFFSSVLPFGLKITFFSWQLFSRVLQTTIASQLYSTFATPCTAWCVADLTVYLFFFWSFPFLQKHSFRYLESVLYFNWSQEQCNTMADTFTFNIGNTHKEVKEGAKGAASTRLSLPLYICSFFLVNEKSPSTKPLTLCHREAAVSKAKGGTACACTATAI